MNRTGFGLKNFTLLQRLDLHEVGENVDGDWEDYGAVVLSGDTIECLEVPQLRSIVKLSAWCWV